MMTIVKEATSIRELLKEAPRWQSRDGQWRLFIDEPQCWLLYCNSKVVVSQLAIAPSGEVYDFATDTPVSDDRVRTVIVSLALAGFCAKAVRVHFWFLDR
jgi:hypothetical protein